MHYHLNAVYSDWISETEYQSVEDAKSERLVLIDIDGLHGIREDFTIEPCEDQHAECYSCGCYRECVVISGHWACIGCIEYQEIVDGGN